MARRSPSKLPRVAPAGFACLLIATACATSRSPQPAPPPVSSAAGPRLAATTDGEWRSCLRFSREWEQASRLSPTPSLSARSVVELESTCLRRP